MRCDGPGPAGDAAAESVLCSALVEALVVSHPPERSEAQRPHLSCAVAPRNGAPRQSMGGLAELVSVRPLSDSANSGCPLAAQPRHRIRRPRTVDRQIMSCIVPEDDSLARSFLVTW